MTVIAEKLGCHPKKVRRWLHRFNAAGIDGLDNRPGVGRKRLITEAQRSAIIALARSVPPGRPVRDGAGELSADNEGSPAEWTLNTLTQAAREAGIGVGRSQVRRILRAEKVRWRRTCTRAASRANSSSPQAMPGHSRAARLCPVKTSSASRCSCAVFSSVDIVDTLQLGWVTALGGLL